MKNLAPFMAALGLNHSVIGRGEAIALGVGDQDLARLCDRGLLERISYGTYRLAGARWTDHGRVMAAVVAARQRAANPGLVAATRMTAAWLLGMTRRVPRRCAVIVPASRTPAPSLAFANVHRSRTLCADDITFVDGVPVTVGSRTIADATINLAVPALMDLIARGLQLGLFTLEQLSEQLRRAGRIRGAPRLRQALVRISPSADQAESRGENVAFDALSAAGFEVVRQHPVLHEGATFRLDLAILALMIAIEIDGYWWHSIPGAKRRDEARQNAIVTARFAPLRYSADAVVRDPLIVVRGVRNLAAQAASSQPSSVAQHTPV
jgi:very-short-patch-repair endonuclease